MTFNKRTLYSENDLTYIRPVHINDSKLVIITDGIKSVQKSKVRCLGLQEIMDLAIYTRGKGSAYQKPQAWSFEYVEEKTGYTGPNYCYFGNDSSKDFLAPNRLGWLTICVKRCSLKFPISPTPEYRARIEINSFDEVFV